MHQKELRISVAVLLLCLVACGKKNKDTPWDRPVTEPLFSSTVSADTSKSDGSTILKTQYCYPDDKGSIGDSEKYTDAVAITQGHSDRGGVDNDGFDWGQGGACVGRSIQNTWAALQNQPLMVWGGVSSSNYSMPVPPGGVVDYFLVNYHVDNPFPEPNVDWQMDWYHSIHGGTEASPTQIVINYRKVNGTKYISYWEGTIILDYIAPNITAISALDHVNAARTNASDSAGSVSDIINKARTGTPDPGALSRESASAGQASTVAKPSFCKEDPNGDYGDTTKYSSAISVTRGHDDQNNFDFVSGGACIPSSMADVLKVTADKNFMSWNEAHSVNVSAEAAPVGGSLFRVDYAIPNFWFFLPSFKWEMEWTQTLSAGTPEDPRSATMVYKKVAGDGSIQHWAGEIDLQWVSPTITSISIRNELNWKGKTADDAELQLRQLIERSRDH